MLSASNLEIKQEGKRVLGTSRGNKTLFNAAYNRIKDCWDYSGEPPFSSDMKEIHWEDHDEKYLLSIDMFGVIEAHGLEDPQDSILEGFRFQENDDIMSFWFWSEEGRDVKRVVQVTPIP